MSKLILIDPTKQQRKGNLHLHTTRSDGEVTPEVCVQKHREEGYDFMMMSDHEIYWDSDCLDTEDFLVLAGTEIAIMMNSPRRWVVNYHRKNEYDNGVNFKRMHYGCIKDVTEPSPEPPYAHDEEIPEELDFGIDSWNKKVAEMRRRGNLVIANHPHWSRLQPEMLLATHDAFAFEVWNSSDVNAAGGYSDEAIWDYCLIRGRRLLAVAADDCHEYNEDFAAGFTMVLTNDFTKAGIVRALKEGDFYASCGPKVHEMTVEDGVLKLRCSPVRQVRITSLEASCPNFFGKNGALLEEMEWKINANLGYFRVELVDELGRKAWCQPVFLDELVAQGCM